MSFFDIFKKKLNPIEPHIIKIDNSYYKEFTEDDGFGNLELRRIFCVHAPDPEFETMFDEQVALFNQCLAKTKQKINYIDEEMTPLAIVKHLFPQADKNTCPYCQTKHSFEAKRVRKCPECGKQMWVRAGRFLTDEQKDYYEKWQELNYKIDWAIDLRNQALDSKDNSTDYARSLISLAQAFRKINYFDSSWRLLAGLFPYIKELSDLEMLLIEKDRFDHLQEELRSRKNKDLVIKRALVYGLAYLLSATEKKQTFDVGFVLDQIAEIINSYPTSISDIKSIISNAIKISQSNNNQHLATILKSLNQRLDSPISL